MEEEKPFLKNEVSRKIISDKIGVSENQLSELLNVCFDQNFYTFINLYRIEKAKEMLTSIEYSKLKLSYIGYEVGFKNRSTFSKVFKSFTNISPSEYQRKKIKG